MSLNHLPIDRINETNLRELIGTPEGRDIDFKLETWGESPEAKREFLADISSFANTLGGDIVIGMREDPSTKVAVELRGIEIVLDKERQRLEACALTGLRPRMRPLQIHALPLANGRKALVIRVSRSFNPPHRVVRDNSNRFWARHTGGKYEPDVDQLRELFTVAPTLAEKIRDFRLDRIAKIRAGAASLPLPSLDTLVLHVVPFGAVAGRHCLGPRELSEAEHALAPIGTSSAPSARFNLEGIVSFAGNNAGSRLAYTQLWRTGQIEAIRAPIAFPRRAQHEIQATPTVESREVERNIVDGVNRYLPLLVKLDLPPPYAILVSLLGLRDIAYDRPTIEEVEDGEAKFRRFDRDVILIPDTVLEEGADCDQVIAKLLRSTFDQVANSAGRIASSNFGDDGAWQGRASG